MPLHEFLKVSARNYPDKTAFVYEGKRYSFLEIDNRSNQLSAALMELGIKKQDRVAVFLEPGIEAVISIFGALKAGGAFVALNEQVKAKKAGYILNDSRAKILIAHSALLKVLEEVLPECSFLENIFVTDSSSDKDVFPFWDILSHYPAEKPDVKFSDDDLASLIYTSGSTGVPKGVAMTHGNMVFAAGTITGYLENTADDIILNVLPFSFDYGLYQLLMVFKFGGTLVQMKALVYPYQYIDLIIKEQVSGLPIVPTVAALLFKFKDLEKFDLSSVRYITNTGQALPSSYIPRLQKIFPKAKIYSMYGLTECKRVSYLPPDELGKRPDSVGRPMCGTEAFIVDDRGDKISEPGKVGELVVKGPHVMKGYWNLPEETCQVLKPGALPREKLLYTGDYFKMDEEGFLYFVSRKDDILKVAGRRVSPKEIEETIHEIEGVSEAAVVGVEDEITGQAIKAFVTLKNGSKLKPEDIIRYCSRRIENFMVPSAVVIQDELPKSGHGKILKKNLL